MLISNKDYLNELIAKAKKSWEGVDVDSYMKNLRDMDAVKIRCRYLMVGDWITEEHGFPMQIVNVGDDYAYATFEGNEGDPWEFDDKDYQPEPIPLTLEMLSKNGWRLSTYTLSNNSSMCWCSKDEGINHLEYRENGILAIWYDYEKDNDGAYSDIIIPVKYVHQLQQVLRLAGMTEMANSFKV